MYNPDNQYRCTIIRGKAQSELDDLLPAYCTIINNICPIEKDRFIESFDKSLARILGFPEKKTIDNHRTEIAGKLFGLWIEKEEIIYSTDICNRYLEIMDNPAFFKELVIKLQFPNGMDKSQTILERVENKIRFRPTPFILSVLIYAQEIDCTITNHDIGYYILNNLETLQGKTNVREVVDRIKYDKKLGIQRRVEKEGKASSFSMQHINEFLNLLELANLIKIEKGTLNIIRFNKAEREIIDIIIEKYLYKLSIDPENYNFAIKEELIRFKNDWLLYYSNTLPDNPVRQTEVKNLIPEESSENAEGFDSIDQKREYFNTTVIGDEGEKIVLEFERKRIQEFNRRLVNKVIYFGKQRGLGYDVQSIFAEGENPEHVIYIEVKTTKRVSEPKSTYNDQFDMTRNEWIAAEQHRDYYYIYRVYIYSTGYKICKINSPVKLKNEGNRGIYAEPIKYHIEFDETIGEFIL